MSGMKTRPTIFGNLGEPSVFDAHCCSQHSYHGASSLSSPCFHNERHFVGRDSHPNGHSAGRDSIPDKNRMMCPIPIPFPDAHSHTIHHSHPATPFLPPPSNAPFTFSIYTKTRGVRLYSGACFRRATEMGIWKRFVKGCRQCRGDGYLRDVGYGNPTYGRG